MRHIETVVFGATLAVLASPALAGNAAPAPIAGVGIGAVLLVGFGYRALRNRTRR